MKAVKLYKIKWNLEGLDPQEREEVLKTLPTSKGFMANDDFEVVDKVPQLLYKKFGYKTETFSYEEIPIYEDFEDLLKIYTPRGEKPKKLYLRSGDLSSYGEEVLKGLKKDISKRFALEGKGVADDAMPVQLDTVMLSIENIFGIKWADAESEDDIFKLINKEIGDRSKSILKSFDKGDSDFDEEEV